MICDVAVIGLGAVGSAALYHLSTQGLRIVGIDRFHPPHEHGSSHGESRITRQAIGEGDHYVPFVLRSNEIWEELEHATGKRLLERCGFVYIARDDSDTVHHGKTHFMSATRGAAEHFGIAHEILDARELVYRFPQFTGLAGDEHAYYEPGGGYLRPEQCISVCLSQAVANGATTLLGDHVRTIRRSGAGVEIVLGDRTVFAERVIVATGAWVGELAPAAIARNVAIHRQVLHWFEVSDSSDYADGASPTFIWNHGSGIDEQFYGFPPIDGLVKVAREDYEGGAIDAGRADVVDPVEREAMANKHVGGRLAGLESLPLRSKVCRYTVTPDGDFAVDAVDGVHYVSACSGHGFKHAAGIGQSVARSAIGLADERDLSPFAASRLRGGT